MEVSMPTGSLCAEHNVIGTALAQNPRLRRQDLKMIAVLAVPPPQPASKQKQQQQQEQQYQQSHTTPSSLLPVASLSKTGRATTKKHSGKSEAIVQHDKYCN